MKKQKICIIGGGLTGLITAITLSKLNLKIDLITDSLSVDVKSSRTIAISQKNYNFLRKLNISNLSKKNFWPCSKMQLYIENKKNFFEEIFEINKDKKQVFYVTEYSKIIKQLIQSIKKNNLISIKFQKTILKLNSSGILKKIKFNKNNSHKYNLIILCTGTSSSLAKNYFHDQLIEYSYKEVAITTLLRHSPLENITARQIFLNKEILALLPISNTKTSIVWTVKKNMMKKYKYKKNIYLKNKLAYYTKNFYKNIKLNSNVEYRDLNFLIRKKYFQDRVLLFGDALHLVHPFVGQGFNMVLRDLAELEKILKNKMSLGLDVGTNDILSEYSKEIKSSNFIYSIGIDFLKKFFSVEKKSFQYFRKKVLENLNNNDFAKRIFFDIADSGIKF